jgi:hypothetical protein
MKVWIGADNGGYSHGQVAQLHKPTEDQKKLKTWWHLEVEGAMDVDELRFHLAHITICATKGDMEGVKGELVKMGMLHLGEGCEEESADDIMDRARRTRCRGCEVLPHCSMPSGTVVPGFQCLTRIEGEPCKEADALPVNALEWCRRNEGFYEENELLCQAEAVPCCKCGELPATLVGDKLICEPCTDDFSYEGAHVWCSRSPQEWIDQNTPPIKDAPPPREMVRRLLQHVMDLHDLNESQRALPALVDAIENVVKMVEENQQHLLQVNNTLGKLKVGDLWDAVNALRDRFNEAFKAARNLSPDTYVEKALIMLVGRRME